MKKIVIFLVFLIIISSVLGCTPKAEKATKSPLVLRYVDIGAGPEVECARQMVKNFNERTVEAYRMEMHEASALVVPPDTLDSIRTGAIEICYVPVGLFAGIESTFGAAELPLMFDNYAAATYGNKQITQHFAKIYEEKYNQKMLTWWLTLSTDLLGTGKPVRSLEDWRGLLIQSISPRYTDMIELFGASAISIPFIEAYSALQRGTVDASIISLTQFDAFSMGEVVDYIVYANIAYAVIGVNINLDVWNSLPENVQVILEEEFDRMGQERREYNRLNEIKIVEELAPAQGVEVVILDAAERERWVNLLQPYIDEFLDDWGEFGQEIRQVAKEANSKF